MSDRKPDLKFGSRRSGEGRGAWHIHALFAGCFVLGIVIGAFATIQAERAGGEPLEFPVEAFAVFILFILH